MRSIICCIFTTLCIFNLFSQKDPSDYAWRNTYKESKSQNIYKITEINDGKYIGVGYTTNKSEGGKDILIVTFNEDGSLNKQNQMGGKYDDIARSVTFTPDGRVLICGVTSSKNSRQGIIIEVFPDLSTQLLYLDENSNNSVFNDIISDQNGTLYVCGTEDSKMIALAINEDRKVRNKYYNLKPGNSSGNALLLTTDNRLIVAGSMEDKSNYKKSSAAIVRLDMQLKELDIWRYAQESFYEATDVVELPNGNFAISGTGLRNRKEAPAVAVLSARGEQLFGKTFNTMIDGFGSAIALTPSGDILISGSGSATRGAKRSNAFCVRIDPTKLGELTWREPYFFGRAGNDACHTVYTTTDGKVLMVGASEVAFSSDFFIHALKPSVRDHDALAVMEKIKILPIETQSLTRNGKKNVTLTVQNNAEFAVNKFNLKLQLITDDPANIHCPDFIITEKMKPGESRTIQIPIEVDWDYQSTSTKLRCTVSGNSDKNYASQTANLYTADVDNPIIILQSNAATIDGSDRNNIIIPVELINTGNIAAQLHNLDILLSENISLADNFIFPKDTLLDINKPLKLNILVRADSLFNADYISTSIFVKQTSGLRSTKDDYDITRLRKSFVVINLEPVSNKEDIVFSNQSIRMDFKNIASSMTVFDRTHYELHFTADATLSNIKSGNKFLINDKAISPDSIMEAGNNQYVVKIPLSTGLNNIVIQSDNKVSQPLATINNQQSKVNYYIYAIGTDIEDEDGQKILQFSLKDCDDFANQMKIMRNEDDRKFESVKVIQLNTYSLTTASHINSVFKDIAKNKNKYKPNDVIIVYWVAQAYANPDGNILIKGSDLFKNKNSQFRPDLHSTKLTSYIIPYCLDEVKCRKILLLDLFNKEDKPDLGSEEKIIYDLVDHTITRIKNFENFDYILAGSNGERSYELPNLKNGAFTYAVVQALKNKDHNADLNNDGVIELAELFSNIATSVPDLVSKNSKDKSWVQNPSRYFSASSGEIVVYFQQ